MKMTVESTTQMVTLNGSVPARVWEGESEGGVKVHVLVLRVAVRNDRDQLQFERELTECAAPSADAVEAFPLRMIL